MHRTARLFALLLLFCQGVATAQYAELRPLLSAANPVVRQETSDGTIVQAGPVKLTFPKGWQFYPDTIGTKALGPGGAVVNIVVLEHPGGKLAQLPDPKTSIPTALTYFCTAQQRIEVELLSSAGGRDTYVGSCVSTKDPEAGPYTFIHEVRYRNRIVQLIHSGTSNVGSAKKLQDTIASSAVAE